MLFEDEGSSSTEDSDVEDVEETQEDSENSNEGKGEEGKTESQTEEKSSDGTLKDQEQKTELTEKGTKLDDNPLSRVNQELANERAKIKQYEGLLNNPALLKNYVKQFDGADEQKQEKTQEQEMRYEDVETTEDLQKFLRQQDSKVQSKLKELDTTISSVKSSQKDTIVASRIQNDITTVRSEYPELDPKSGSYSKELDLAVGELYEKFDLDTNTNAFKGQVSIKDIADIVMRAAGSSKKQGSTEAQTTIRDKRTGKAVSGASSQAPDESGMTAGQLIASRMRRASSR